MDGVYKTSLPKRSPRAEGFVEGIEAAAKWHEAEAMRLVAIVEVERLEGRFAECTEMLNLACDHALCVPAILALQRVEMGSTK